jgi:hypothetical protein
MAAAAFTETLIFRGASSKKPLYVRATVSDVAAAYAIYPDGSNVLQLPSNENWFLVDAVIVVGGTDTTNQELYVNQMATGIVIDNKSNLNTVQNRIFQANPLGFTGGSQIKLIQRA